MRNSNNTEAHPAEIALLTAWVVLEALLTLVVALVVLTQSVVDRPAPHPPGPAPAAHPLSMVAEELQALTCAQLRAITGTRRKCSKAELIAAMLAC